MPSRPPGQHGRHQLQAALLGVSVAAEQRRKAAAAARARRILRLKQQRIRRENERLRRSTAAFGVSLESELTYPSYAALVQSAHGMTNVDRLVNRVIPMLQKHVQKYPKPPE